MATPSTGASPSGRLRYVGVFFLVPALVLAYQAVSRAGDGDADRGAALAVFALGFFAGAVAGAWLMIKESRRTDEQLRAGTGGAISGTVAAAIVLLFLPYIFFGDELPEILNRLIAGLLSGSAVSFAVGLVVLARIWGKRGF